MEVVLSFYPTVLNYVNKRSDKFIENIHIEEQIWINAVKIALHEYFYMIEKEILKDDTYSDKILTRYITVWNEIK
ncbi:hypothetical protein DXN04_33665 [Chitinophaga silvisoli]|uniref:Uncharacterized protein n=1 Tax=Chitinophaga silvisoli TaxID=2291814 RepID=A0A3E1NN33_9BACT|nr:hypothetical protein DXN04_33665 [Chitinophaga silvisoli]